VTFFFALRKTVHRQQRAKTRQKEVLYNSEISLFNRIFYPFLNHAKVTNNFVTIEFITTFVGLSDKIKPRNGQR